MDVKDISPFVRQALFGKLSVALHTLTYKELKCSDCRLFYVLSGKGKMITDDGTYDLVAGTCVLLKSATSYMWQPDAADGLSLIIVNFDYTSNASHIKEPFHPVSSQLFKDSQIIDKVHFDNCDALNKPLVLNSIPSIEDRLRVLTMEYEIGNEYCDELLSSILRSVIFSILRQLDDEANSVHTKQSVLTREIILYIQQHYNEPLTNADLTRLFHFNAIYINRVFKRRTGVTVQKFLTDYRLRMGAELLKSSDSSIGEISALVGLDDLAYFSKIFKRNYGVTPSQYRKMKLYTEKTLKQ